MRTKRILSLLLALEMIFCMLPVSSFASEAPEFPDERENILEMQEEVPEEEPIGEPEPEDPVIVTEVPEEIQEENLEELSEAAGTEDPQEEVKEEPEAEEKTPEPFEPERMFDFEDSDVSTIYEMAPALEEEEFARLTGIEDWTDYSYRLYDLRLEDASGAVCKGGAVEFAPGFANPADSMRVFLIKEEVLEDEDEDEEAAEDEDENRNGEKQLVSYEAEIEFDKESQRVKFYAESLPSRWLFVGEPDQWVKLQSRISSLPDVSAVENAEQALELEIRLLEVDAMADALREGGEGDVEIFDRVNWEKYNVLRELVGSFRRDEKIAAVNAAVAMLPELEAVEDAEQAASIEAQLAEIDVLLQELRDAGMTKEELAECISLEKYSAALEDLNAYKETLEEEQEPEEIVLSATVENIVITLTADAGAFGDIKPEELTLSVRKIEEETAEEAEKIEEAVAEKREANARVASSFKFDITVLNPAGEELQPGEGASVKVSFALAEVVSAALDVNVYHVKEETDEALTAETLNAEQEIVSGTEEEPRPEETVVTFETDGFSIYVVEFTYGPFEYVLPGDESVSLSEIQAAIGLPGTVTAAEVSNSDLFTAVQNADGQDWTVTALQPFDTEEWMKITIGGVEYEILVTDENSNGNAPGTRQQITKEELDDGVFLVYHAVENGVTLTLYCFNSELVWPVTGNPDLTDYYVPDEMLNLSDEVKDKIYRILYAGYPHNNLGLYSTGEDPITYSELADAVVPPQALKDLLPDYNWGTLSFTPENLVADTTESSVMDALLWSMFDDDCYAAMLSKPNFISFLSAWQFGPYPSVEDLLDAYASMKPTSSPGDVHDATQIAIWRILYENGAPNNNKPLTEELNNYPIAKQLVDFANGVGEYADASIPDRGTKISDMEAYKATFETGSMLLRADGSPVGAYGIIVFTENENGEYASEPLHFADGTYALPYTITLDDGTTAVTSVINHGTGEFVLISPSRSTNGQVTVETENLFPSDVYQYVVESQKDIPASELSHDANHVQDMSGVYYQSVPMSLRFGTEFREAAKVGSLKVEKTVKGTAGETDRDFEFTVTLDESINGTYGEMIFTNGVASFTLKDKETKLAENLPAGVHGTVTETDYSSEGYVTTSNGSSGEIVSGRTMNASFVNTKDAVSSLTIRKMVAGNDADYTKYFHFTITLNDNTINETYSGVEFKDGVGKISLKHKETKVIEGLPDGIDYEVTEDENGQDVNTETTVKGSSKGTISATNPSEVEFVNTRNTYGALTVRKTVEGNAGNKSKPFDFTVTLSDKTISGTYGGMTFTNGVATFSLQDGLSLTAENLPNGINYEVKEADYSSEGYVTDASGAKGSIVGNDTMEAKFVNTRNAEGSLTVHKKVAGNDADDTRYFHFTITLADETINETHDGVEFINGVGKISLKHNEQKVIKLPNMIGYTVTEDESNQDGYSTTVEGSSSGTISETSSSAVTFINTRNTYGNLRVEKTVEGNAGDPNKDFRFRVELSDKTISHTYGGMTFVNGVASFALKHGESKTARRLPNGIGYVVLENYDIDGGYVTEKSGDEGNIIGGGEVTAKFINTRNANGSLTINKILEGNDTDSTKDFTFTITLNNALNGTYSGITFTNGVGTFTLKGGESKLIEGLPNGTGFTVTEADSSAEGYETASRDASGTISETKPAAVEFLNRRNTFGSLVVSKTVSDNLNEDKKFEFTVELSDKTISGTYGGMTFVNGVAEFTLTGKSDNTQKTAENLPNGIEYTVFEKDYIDEGFITTISGANGTIEGGKTKTAAFTNTRNEKGTLTLLKILEGNAADSTKEFTFTITLTNDSGAPVSWEYGGVTHSDGVGTVKLKGGESVVLELPDQAHYSVTEADYSEEGYETASRDESGVIDDERPIAVEFKNTRNLYGDLTVSKTVTGNACDLSKEFEFTVELSDKTITGLYGEMAFQEGKATFRLKNGKSITATDLPHDITYTVTELIDEADGYVTDIETTISDKPQDPATAPTTSKDVTTKTGTILGDKIITEAFTNTRDTFGTLKVTKTVAGNAGETGKAFSFTVALTDAQNKPVSGIFDGVTFDAKGETSFTLTSGQYKTLTGLPHGVRYKVVEEDYSAYGYGTTKTGDTGTIDGDADEPQSAAFINTRNVGSLSISKTVTGDLADKNKSFRFTITFKFKNKDDYDTRPYAYTGSKNGSLISGDSIYLKHGETITFNELPEGTKYTVAESENSGYNVYKTNAEGVITTGETARVSFTNSRSSVPATGDSSALPMWLGMMLLSVIGTAGAFLLRRRKIR